MVFVDVKNLSLIVRRGKHILKTMIKYLLSRKL